MPVLNRYDIAKIALSVWSPESAIIAVAISKRESGWNTRAHNPKPPDNSYGLWQINMLGQLGVNRRAQFKLTSNEQLFDPWVNARVAHAVSNGGTNWRPWSVYTNGSYRVVLAEATEAVKYIQANPDYKLSDGTSGTIGGPDDHLGIGLPLPDIPNPLEPVAELVKFVTDKHNWFRLGLFLAGAALLALGVALLAKQIGTNTIVSQVGKVITKGAKK